jgi:hypothetical protein
MSVALDGPDGSRWYTAEEAAEVLRVKHQTIHKLVERRHLLPRRLANISVFNSRDLEAYILRRRRPGRPTAPAKTAARTRSRRTS